MAGVDFLAEGGFCLVVCCWVVVMFGGLVSLEKVMFFVVGLFVVVVVCWFVVVGVGCCCFRIGVGLIVGSGREFFVVVGFVVELLLLFGANVFGLLVVVFVGVCPKTTVCRFLITPNDSNKVFFGADARSDDSSDLLRLFGGSSYLGCCSGCCMLSYVGLVGCG